MVDAQNASITKERIVSMIKTNGPSLPVAIAKSVNIPPLFAGAFLSELYAERKIKMSSMRVGSSPLYYVDGQEDKLENFIQYLNEKEKEAFMHIKKEKLLDDEKQVPAIRVALRAIKDFAIPIKLRLSQGEEPKLFWKHFLTQDSEISELINKDVIKALPKAEPIKTEEKQTKTEETKAAEEKKEKEYEKEIKNAIKNEISQEEEEIEEEEEQKIIKPQKQKKEKEFAFTEKLRDYLTSKDIELLSVINQKSKEVTAKIRIDTPFGKQEYYLIAKDKKKITEDELAIAIHKAQAEKMIALIMAPGEIDKKALDYHKTWRNMIKFEKVKF